MLYFILGIIIGLLVNPFRKETKEFLTSFKNEVTRPHATFSEPLQDISNVEKITDIIHE